MSTTPIEVNFSLPTLRRLADVNLDIEVLNDEGTAYDFTGKRVDIGLARTPNGTQVRAISSVGVGAELTLTAGNIAIAIAASDFDLDAETYYFTLRIGESDLSATEFIASGTWIIKPNISPIPA